VQVRLSDPTLIDDLRAWLERVRCSVEQLDERTLAVEVPNPIPAGRDDIQLDLFLRVWEVRQDGRATARRVEEDQEPDDRSGLAGGLVRF